VQIQVESLHERDYMNDIINKNIKVAGVEAKMASTGNMKFIITDTEKNKYYFYQKNKGVDCDVYMSFTGMGLKQGDTCNIGFTEEAKSFQNQKGETINYTDRFILGLREVNGAVPTPAPSQTKTSNTSDSGASQNPSDDQYWDKKAYKQCLWGKWLKDSVQLALNEPDWKDIVWDAFKEIGKDADKRFSPVAQAVTRTNPNFFNEPELPVIQQDEPPLSAYEQDIEFVAPDIAETAHQMKNGDINVDDIPFN
jgi:hypothetical protein